MMVLERHSHRAIDNKGHHNIHVCDVLLQIRIGQVKLCTSEKENSAKITQTCSEDVFTLLLLCFFVAFRFTNANFNWTIN